mgnify:CR=1 FL=1
MDFNAFGTQEMEEYARRARESWGQTKAYQEYEQKFAGKSLDQEQQLASES